MENPCRTVGPGLFQIDIPAPADTSYPTQDVVDRLLLLRTKSYFTSTRWQEARLFLRCRAHLSAGFPAESLHSSCRGETPLHGRRSASRGHLVFHRLEHGVDASSGRFVTCTCSIIAHRLS